MRTKFTNVSILLAVAAGAAMTMAGCSPDTTAPEIDAAAAARKTERRVEDLRAKYGWLGTYHSDGLAYVYARLANSGKIHGQSDACRIASQALKEFHRTARSGEIPYGLVDPSIENEVCPESTEQPAPARAILSASLPEGVRREELSAPAIAYMDQISVAIDNATERAVLLGQISSIEFAAAAELPEDEAGAVTAVASIAVSSVDYWEENLDSWSSVGGGAELPLLYTRAGTDGMPGAGKVVATAPGAAAYDSKWWQNPFLKGYLKVVGADAAAGARVLYTSWCVGPLGWDAAAAAALWGSVTMAATLLF